MHWLTPFCGKTNLRENRFLRQGGRLIAGQGTHNVKMFAEKLTKFQVDGMTGAS